VKMKTMKGTTKIEESSSNGYPSSSEDKENGKHHTCILKPPKFDRKIKNLFQTFWAKFRNCAKRKWNRDQELVYLKSSLDKEVANVL